jgi:autotransporter-associated beta strand protein
MNATHRLFFMKSPIRPHVQSCLLAALTLTVAIFSQRAQANLAGPYAADTNTVYLFHFDEPAGSSVATNATGTLAFGTNAVSFNGQPYAGDSINQPTITSVFGASAFTGFGAAADLSVSNAFGFGVDLNGDGAYRIDDGAPVSVDRFATHHFMGAANAFTIEALIKVPAITGSNKEIVATDHGDGTAANRGLQFRLNTAGTLEFNFIGSTPAGFSAAIPTSGDHAFDPSQWFHVAVTHDGVNTRLYWTRMDATNVVANQIGLSTTETMDINDDALIVIGNEGRALAANGSQEGLLGQIDEVRISRVARGAGDMMFFAPVVFVMEGPTPTNNIVAVGQPASFSINVGGLNPTYQWRHAGTNIPGATTASLIIPAATGADAGNYDVVLTNNFSAITSSVATLTVRTPVNLTWAGSGFASGLWNTTDVNWDSTGDTVADLAYIPGDHVRFDDNGLLGGNSTVDYSDTVTPSTVVVSNTVGDYYFISGADTGLVGSNGSLVKQGGSTLIINTDNSNTGGTLIDGGVIQVGFGGARGALGSGPITNNTGLVFNRTGNLTVPGNISGAAGLTNLGSGNIILSGTNTYSGDTAASAGVITLANAQALGSSVNVVLTTTAGGPGLSGTRLALAGGISAGAGVTVTMPSSLVPDYRCNLFSNNGSNIWNGAVVLDGDGQISFGAEGASLIVAGPITGPNFNGGKLIMRGNGLGILSGSVNLPNGHCSKTEGGTWVFASSGNVWTNTDIAIGTLRLGVNNAIPVTASVNMTGGNLDLAGFNQTLAVLNATSGPIGNSSTNSDSLLTINSNTNYTGVIQDSVAGGTRKVAVTISGGLVTLGGGSTYTGNTTVSSGTLALAGNGNIGGSAVISLATGTTWDLSLKTGAGAVLGVTQTLKGTGTVIGSVTNNGTIAPGDSIGTLTFNNDLVLGSTGTLAIEVNKLANTKDVIAVAGDLIYGGTLNVTNLAGTLNIGDSFTICPAGLPTGNFATVTGAAGSGQAWSFNPTTGVVSVVAGVNTTPTNITAVVTGGGTQYDLSWPATHTGWTLQAQTNSLSVGLATNWVTVAGSAATNHVIIPINPANGSVFFRLVYP